jgi:hypothetical protein
MRSLWSGALLALFACVRPSPGSTAEPDASPPVASAAAPAVPTPSVAPSFSGPATVSLVVLPGQDGDSADVRAMVPALSIEEPVATIHGASACTSWWHGGVWSVSCTPSIRAVRLSLRPVGGSLIIERNGVAVRSVATPPGSQFEGPEQTVGVRDAADAGCPGDAGVTSVDLGTQAELTDAPGIGLQLAFGGTSVFLGEMRGATECVAKGDGDERVVRCDGRPACTLQAAGGRVSFACDLPTHVVGALMLPCRATPKLPTGTLPRTVHYR